MKKIIKVLKIKLYTKQKNKGINLLLSIYKINVAEFENKLDKFTRCFQKNILLSNVKLIIYSDRSYEITLKEIHYYFIFNELLKEKNVKEFNLLDIYKVICLQIFLQKGKYSLKETINNFKSSFKYQKKKI